MPKDFIAESADILERIWKEIIESAPEENPSASINDDILHCINSSINSPVKTYRYVLPTQLVAKLANPKLNSRCIQASLGGKGAFDARTIAHKMIVPFDQQNNGVLGGSTEPYVNNPLRVPEFSAKYRKSQKNKTVWDCLCKVLDSIEQADDPNYTMSIFRQVSREIYNRLATIKITYPSPLRISLDKAMMLIGDFLHDLSGGDRLLALTSAIFMVIGDRMKLFSKVERAHITASDASTGLAADLECLSEDGELILAVEVKDRILTVNQIRGKIPAIRERKISEVLFIAQRGIASEDEAQINQLIQNEFVIGHNYYVIDFFSLATVVLALIGEDGRRDFLAQVGNQLDSYDSEISSRRAWAHLLSEI
ncbi:MAG: hypothetical protein A2W25_09150 [candidate division Zixibacteria bacterium RBG_16_53_22]|nr:MAG: hypothetical protein A2W25_09150 [candidate division Zixibacteria bacterium RBG_16_53_22]